MRTQYVIAALGLALLDCTTNNVKPVQAPELEQKAVELSASSVRELQTRALGARIAFAVNVCPKPGLLPVPIGTLAPAIASAENEAVPRVTPLVSAGCHSPELRDPSQRANCEEHKAECSAVFGVVSHAGPITLEFLGRSKRHAARAAVFARLPLNLPAQAGTSIVSNSGIGEGMNMLAAIENGRLPSAFGSYWKARGPIVFPDYATVAEGTSGRAEDQDPLWDPWLNSSQVIEKVNMGVLGGWLDVDEPATIPVDAVRSPRAVVGKRRIPSLAVTVPEISRWVPADAAWVHFRNVRKFEHVLDAVEELASGALTGVLQDAKERKVRARYAAELGVNPSALTRLFDEKVADDMALVVHDFSLRDGADVTLLLHFAANGDARGHVNAVLDARAKAATVTAEGRDVELRRTEDGTVNSHLHVEGNWVLLSNSKVALLRVLETARGMRASVGVEPEYRYLLGTGSKNADGMLYMGGAFWDAQQTAERRVAHRRRLLCASAMQVLSSAVLGYRRDRGQSPTLPELVSAKYLFEDDLRCPDGGTLSLKKEAAHCSIHGTLASLSPVIEHLPKVIKASERDGYRASITSKKDEDSSQAEREEVESTLTFPMAIEFTAEPQFVAKVRTLPNVDSEQFEALQGIFGTKSTNLNSRVSLGDTVAALGAFVDIARLIQKKKSTDSDEDENTSEGSEYRFGGRYAPDRWLTGKIQLFFGDGAPVLSLPYNVAQLSQLATASPASMGIGLQMLTTMGYSVLMAPVSGVVELKDAELAQQVILGKLARLSQEKFLLQYVDKYELLPYRDVTVHVLSVAGLNMHLYFAFLDKNLVLTNRKSTMLALIDASLDPNGSAPRALHGQLALQLHPKAFRATLDGLENSWQERLRHVCNEHLKSFELLAQSLGPKGANDATVARTYFGFEAKCPEGGSYKYDPLQGGAYCTLHGRTEFSRQPTHLSQHAESSKIFRAMKDISWSFSLTNHVLESELRIERY